MLKTLNEWYSLQQITNEQYYQLLPITNPSLNYSLDELQLLAELPSTEHLKPLGKRNLTKYQAAVNDWDTYQTLRFDYLTMMVLVAMFIIIIRNIN